MKSNRRTIRGRTARQARLGRSTALALAGTLAFGVGSLAARPARAQESPFQAQGWAPPLSLEPDALPHIESTRMPGRWNWNIGAAVQLAERPYVGRDLVSGGSFRFVDYQLWTHLIAGIGLFANGAVALELPVLLSQNGDGSRFGQPMLGAPGLGDARLTFRFSSRTQNVRDPRAPAPAAGTVRPVNNPFVNDGLGIAGLVTVTAPTGDARSLAGAGAFTAHAAAVGDVRLFGLIAAATLGYRFRFDASWPAQSGDCSVIGMMSGATVSCLAGVGQRDAITWGVGLRLPQGLLRDIVAPYFEAFGQIDARRPFTVGTSPVELGLGAQRVFFHDLTVTLGVGMGVTDAPGTPRFRALTMVQWAPRFIDEDGDGLRDNTGEDRCPGWAEDRDGYQDDDGCAEDNDNDDVPDAQDRCPFVDEDVDDFEDEDGCPDPDNDNDGVEDTRDQCRNEAQGPHPDEARVGCPSDDIDHDGVRNAVDQCPEVPQGPEADPSRAGCPAPDADHDGVPDLRDRCPAETAEPNAPAERQGCLELDADHDGVLDANDRCANEAETINGLRDDDGCAEAGPAARGGRARVRILPGENQAPGAIELLESVRFTQADAIDRASEPLVHQLAVALVATARVPWRSWVLRVQTTAPTVRGPAAIDAARANRRRDALVTMLRARGVAEWALVGGDPIAPLPRGATRAQLNTRRGGVVLEARESRGQRASASAAAPSATAPSAPANPPAPAATPATPATPAAPQAPSR